MRAYLFPTLTKDQIEVKVKKVTQGGALLLLYKTARTDYDILDDVLGPDGWKVEYSEIKGNLYCTLSVWSDGRGEWISKQNCGTESREDGEGNEKKGEASDAMKRAGVTLGIGRELYTSPVIYANVPTTPKGDGFALADRYQTFDVKEIGYDEQRRINRLIIVDNKGAQVFAFPRGGQSQPRTYFVPSGGINPNSGEPMGYDIPAVHKQEPKPESPVGGMPGANEKPCDPKQVKIIADLSTQDELKALKKLYGESFERLSLEGAVKVIAKAKEARAKEGR